jgi:hypothetical protein
VHSAALTLRKVTPLWPNNVTEAVTQRRFPPPWSIEELPVRHVVRDRGGQPLAYLHFGDQPGRRSKTAYRALLQPNVTGKPDKLLPPKTLTAAERAVFLALVDVVATDHFTPADLPLLTAYCQAVAIVQQGQPADDLIKFGLWERAAKLAATLATRLRISPQSRYDARAAARHQQGSKLPFPWETTNDAATPE